MKKLIVFDLDGTLAPSKSSLAPQTAALLHDLLGIIKVAVISGGAWTQFEKQLLTDLPQGQSPRELVPASNVWNKILPIQREVDGTLFRGSDSGPKKEDHRLSEQSCG